MLNSDKKLYSLAEAIDLVKKSQRAKFIESLDLSLKLGIDANKPEQHVKGFTDLTNDLAKKRKIVAIVSAKDHEEAEKAGADYVGEKYIDDIAKGWMDFDVVVATPDVMAKIGKIGKILGTKGLMPNAKYGTISKDIGAAIKGFKKSRIVFKNDKYGLLNSSLGKSNFDNDTLLENITHFLREILKLKPATSKGQYIRAAYISLTMGPSFKLDHMSLMKDLRS
jgi:large subunit ribosomal protein L1